MRIDVLTLFPRIFEGMLSESIVKRAREGGAAEIDIHNLRDHGIGRHRQVDDTPCGGGPGMLLKCEPVFASVRALTDESIEKPHLVMLTPQGRTFTQSVARELATKPRLLMLCGHYEGFDERIREGLDWDEITIGDYVLTGGEVPAMVLIDSIVRLLPGVLGDQHSTDEESFEEGLLEYPQYTRPTVFEGMTVPDVLLSGHHEEIRKWRRGQAEERTRVRRPDLWRSYRDNQGDTAIDK